MRNRLLRISLFTVLVASACTDDSTQSSQETLGDGSRIHRADSGQLTTPSKAAAHQIVRDYLAGYVGPAADQMVVVTQTTSHRGMSHVRLEQQIDGLRVYGAYVKAAITDHGELVQVIEKLAPVGTIFATSVKAKDALAVAMKEHGYEFATPAQTAASGNKTSFARGTEFYREPTAERVVYSDAGTLREGYLVETWSGRGNQLDHTLVGSDGKIVSTERRTQNESYNVFVEDPSKGGQVVKPGPGGWLGAGAQTSTNISGPNAHAYLDVDANNAPDTGGTPVTDGNFLATADLAVSPTTTGNRAVAVQNLFYLNNLTHDILASHGFTVEAGNFEGNDPVNAEAQDGSGTDNANMSTPADGSSPRMQMYLWTGSAPSAIATVGGTAYDAYASSFGPALTTTGVNGNLAFYNDGAGVSATDGCEASTVSLTGKVALLDRGNCDFTVKVMNAQTAGATAVLIANNVDTNAFGPGGTSRKVKIPSAMISQADGATLRAGGAGAATNLKKNPVVALQIDGDVDADIVYHEYGHGLTWRMIGSMSGAISGAIGEGSSDTLAFLLNGDDRIGEYSFSDPVGIRRAAYENYGGPNQLSYKDVNGGGVHADGELFAAAMWKTWRNYEAAGLPASELLHDFVQSMNLINPSPKYEDMRTGLVSAAGPARACMVWRGFAAVGIGQGSSSTLVFSKGKYTVKVVESHAVPTGC
ncbi:MAG: M36 family metallopeptidase [Deltaproteobacteria bacterium]|nr:M36 family metallopeptidase [Deltaproteobacteria bacterium]